MTDVATYLLKFDFSEFDSEVSRVVRTYTEFGTSIRDVVNNVSEDLSTLQQTAVGVSASLAGLTPQVDRSFRNTKMQLGSTVRGLEDLSRNSEKVANNVTRLSGMKLGSLVGGGGAAAPAQSKATAAAESARATADVAEETAQVAVLQSKQAEKRMKEADTASKKQINSLMIYVKAEIDSAKSSIRGLLSHVPGGVMSGGVLSGLMNAMILGYTETDRIRAETGEMKNVFEATGESLFGAESRRATGWFASFQERAQWFYGVTRQETQGVIKSMVEAGFRSKEVMTTFDKSLGQVGKNVTVASIAADKHFNQATGTSMKNIIQITTELGDELGEATDKYVKLAFMGQRSAMGVEKFTNAVLSGASAMQQYGVDVKDVADMMGKIQRHYEDMGLSPQYAGDQASRVIQGMGSGLASLSPGMKTVLAQRMFPELGALDALQKWEDGFLRAGRGEGNEFMTRAFVELQGWATEGGQGRPEAIKIMEMQGLDNRTAATVHDLGDKLGQHNDLTKLTAKERKHFTDAFKTEGQRLSSLHKTQRQLYNGIADIGRGLLKILVSILGVLATGIRAIPEIVSAALSLKPGEAIAAISDVISRQKALFQHMGVGVKDIVRGSNTVGKALGKEFRSALKPLEESFEFEPEKADPAGDAGKSAAAKAVQKVMQKVLGTEDAPPPGTGALPGSTTPTPPPASTAPGAAMGGPVAQNLENLRGEMAGGGLDPLQMNVDAREGPDTPQLKDPWLNQSAKGRQTVKVSGDRIAEMRQIHQERLVIG